MTNVKLWLDDLRVPPDTTWLWVKTAPLAIAALQQGGINHISLDHDLGNDIAGTGYTVACWLEQCAAEGLWEWVPHTIAVHSANPVGRKKIMAAITTIEILRRR